MHPLAGEPLLQAWELGMNQGYLDRALTMLHGACPEAGSEELMALSIPQLNVQLLRLRQISFGSTLAGFVPCSHCAARLEFSIPIAPLLEQVEPMATLEPAKLTDGTTEYSLRPVSSRDLALAQREAGPEQARRLLIGRCVTALSTDPSAEPQLTEQLNEMVLQRLNQLNAAAEITLQVPCPVCNRSEAIDLDIARFLWMEVRHEAIRLLREVHEMASAYGWDEKAILDMNPQRRNAYLEMLHS